MLVPKNVLSATSHCVMTFGREFQVHPLSPVNYRQEVKEGKVDSIADPKHYLCFTTKFHCCTLSWFFRTYRKSYECDITVVYFLLSVSSEYETYTSSVHRIHDRQLVNGGCSMVELDTHHRRCSVRAIRFKDSLTQGPDLLRMQFFWLDDKATLQAHSRLRSRAASVSIAVVQRRATLTDMMQSPLM